MSARTQQTNNNAEALDDFISAKFEIDAMLERLKGFNRPLKKSAVQNGFLSAQLSGFGFGRLGADGMRA